MFRQFISLINKTEKIGCSCTTHLNVINLKDVKLSVANSNKRKVDGEWVWVDKRMKILLSPFYKAGN